MNMVAGNTMSAINLLLEFWDSTPFGKWSGRRAQTTTIISINFPKPNEAVSASGQNRPVESE